MILAVDTHYSDKCVTTAGVLFARIQDAKPAFEHVVTSTAQPAEYVPGEFYKREMPEILSLLSTLPIKPDLILIDGYCVLDSQGRLGLGGHLFEALDKNITIIGVAKSAFRGSPHAAQILRGASKTPLYVTACGEISQQDAGDMIQSMHGDYRIPDLLKRADYLCRHSKPAC